MLRSRFAGVAGRWASSALEPEQYRELSARLRGEPSRSELAEIHEQVRNSVRLHTRVHLHVVRRGGRPLREDLQELERLVAAPLSSLGRRLGGVQPGAPQDPGLLATWERATRAFLGTG